MAVKFVLHKKKEKEKKEIPDNVRKFRVFESEKKIEQLKRNEKSIKIKVLTCF